MRLAAMMQSSKLWQTAAVGQEEREEIFSIRSLTAEETVGTVSYLSIAFKYKNSTKYKKHNNNGKVLKYLHRDVVVEKKGFKYY